MTSPLTIREGYTYGNNAGRAYRLVRQDPIRRDCMLMENIHDGERLWFYPDGQYARGGHWRDLITETAPPAPPSPPIASIKLVQKVTLVPEVTPGPLWEGCREFKLISAHFDTGYAHFEFGFNGLPFSLTAPELRKLAAAALALADGMEAKVPE